MKKRQTSLDDFLTKKPKSDVDSVRADENHAVVLNPQVENKIDDTLASDEGERSRGKFQVHSVAGEL